MNYDVPAKSTELTGGVGRSRQGSGRTCLLVLGMHRSGTSALTRVLSLAGAELPQRLMGGGNGNEAGHWEPSALVQFHDRMLAEIGSAWHDWRQTDFSTIGPRGRDALKRDIAAIIAEDYGDSPLFVLKDPRICRFADIIIETLEHFGVRVVPILALRNPLDVVGSMKTRGFDLPDDHSAADGAFAWLRHMLDADWATRQLPRVIVSYEHVLADWRAQLSKIADVGKVEFPYGAYEIATLVDEFIAPDLRHFASTSADLIHNPMLRGWVSDAYGALRILEQEPASKNALNQLDDIRHSFNRAAPLVFGLVSSVRNFSQDKLSQSLAATEQAKQQREAETVAAISQLEAANAQLKQHVESLQGEIASAKSTLTARDASLVEVTRQVSEASSALHRQEHVSRTLKEEGEKLQASLADLSKSLEEKEAEVQSRIAQSNAAEEGVRQRDEAMRALAAEKQTLEDRISELTKLVDSKMAAIDAAAEQASEAERSIRDREEAIAELRSRLEAAMEQASSIERALAHKTGEAEQLSTQIRDLTSLAEAKAAALDAAEHHVRELEEQQTNVEKLNQKLDIQLASLRELKAAEYDSAQERERTLDEKVAKLEASLKHVQDELTSLNQELVVTKEREAAARSSQRSLESEIASAREQLDEAATSELSTKQTLTAALTKLESRLAEQGCLLDEKAAGLAAEAATARALEQQVAERNQKLIEAENERAAEAARAAALEGQLTQRAHEIEAAWQASEAARVEIDRTHQMYRSSTSWKLTAPFRGVKTVPRVIGRLFRVVPAAVRFGGGVMPTVRKAVRVLSKEGVPGIALRYRNLAKPSVNRPVTAETFAYVAAAPVAVTIEKPAQPRHKVAPVIVAQRARSQLQAQGGMVVISMLRNEIGILPEFASHVLSLFDKWICIDHNSTDGTYEYLSGLASSNENISLLRYLSPGYFQSELMTHIVSRHRWCLGADWVFMLDADEFLPFDTRISFKQAMDSHNSHAIIRMCWKNLVPETFDRDGIGGKRFYVPKGTAQHSKVAFQPKLVPVNDYAVAQGNHDLVVGTRPAPLLAVGAFDLYHIPLRTFFQLRKKLEVGIASYNAMGGDDNSMLGLHWRKIAALLQTNALDQSIGNHVAFSYGTFDFANGFRMSHNDLVAAGATLTQLNVALDKGITRDIPDINGDIENMIDIRIGADRKVHTSGMHMNNIFQIDCDPSLRGDGNLVRALTGANVVPSPTGDVLGQFMEPSYAPIRHLTPTSWAGHIPFMLATMQLLRPRRFVELGSHWGASFFAACQSVATYGGDCDCIAIDLWQGDHQAGYYDESVFNNFTWILKENYADVGRYIRADFNEASLLFEDGSIDLLHIDGLHTYAAVKNDFDTWRTKLSPNGTILFHDTMVHRDDFAVYQFWDEIKSQTHSFNFKHTHGLGVLAFGDTASNPMAFLIDYIGKNGLENLFELHFSRLGKLTEMEALAKHQAS